MTLYIPKILVIDDDKRFCETLQSLVARMKYHCFSAFTLSEGMDILNQEIIDLVFLDVNLPDGNGIDHIDHIKNVPSSPEIIMLTGQGDPDGAEIAIQKGVWDYLVKPSSVKATQLSLNRALTYRSEKKNDPFNQNLSVDNIIGTSKRLSECFDTVGLASRSDSNVLITGETGTGKELFAKTIHDNSHRSGKNFIIVDCASLTETLVESILFGHKKGAFTSAESDRTGLVKLADSGTLFLDEVGELPMSIQKTFLRVLQEKRFRPVGDTRELSSNFRLIAATNRSLEAMVAENAFRHDLLFRLCTITLHLPPLKERIEDIRPLTGFYLKKLCQKYNLKDKEADPELLSMLSEYDWPGNVRQLFNVLERAVISSGNNEIIYSMDLPQDIRIEVTRSSVEKSRQASIQTTAPPPDYPISFDKPPLVPGNIFRNAEPALKDFKTTMEKQYLEEIICYTNKNIKQILSISGLSRSHFYALLKKNNISTKLQDTTRFDDDSGDSFPI